MQNLTKLIEGWADHAERTAIVCDGATLDYAQLHARICYWRKQLQAMDIAPGACISLRGKVSGDMIGLLFALVENANVVVPFLSASDFEVGDALATACVDGVFEFSNDGGSRYTHCDHGRRHPLLDRLRGEPKQAGLILFTSGSTGKNKASVHRFSRLIAHVLQKPGAAYRTLIFLMFDHIGGVNTLLHVLFNGGTAVFVADRSVAAVCHAIESQRVQLLPTTPTFLNMLLISDQHHTYDLSSLELITYGTEPMSLATLKALNQALPGVRCKQTYGLTEVGILPTRSEDASSTWMRVGGQHHETRIVDGILWIRTDAAMIGYLNAPSPFDQDGWLNTGDKVEERDGYLRILGRESEIINVGGEKVYPSEIENLILQVENISDVVVSGKTSALTGQLVFATVQLIVPEPAAQVERRVRAHCREHLPPFKVPVGVGVSEEPMFGARFKKIRRPARKAQDDVVNAEREQEIVD
ncbi:MULTISPECIES: fatty acid--CoA ligase family protein [unclassified Lysobacter]|uniref:class I adenylate-forming enzyme family protein n=1 Tax=unclassified Lysobacter TaxID=2635362 RepID=UPI001BEC6890|nr:MULTISPECIES: fatty acid--CoA ligase family protein [unclassified Lysobacter]MBT2744883.1 long-chain fatty acid--CoA ligase [Lysobacter sp. ISL-42]MBT2752124.1 long-chain fatty acid--CoA ligase [Lysobacter sp. ISL-50]MBT2778621.1 long-chain fatty acid--CoA ligase [Lysobacter sp. ISL-54]MBT2780448.1 long-chain fatty acid--CoA ligase [Lysobacter sp. ISL-52]